ncbi:hypothetical protein MHBO_000368 [Bonamia ostreae]|uniref:J domain-containing protein n=1 Tax=Bonamia ostreae TaxID=126728 RepID=A0ABV2AG86_9EUKA
MSQIKKKYYQLSLKYHPDKIQKGKLNVETEKKYILIKKAYQTLTDPVARENFKHHGHPDGRQGISITIGLPSFLTSNENEKLILFVYVASLIFLIVSVYFWWKKASKFNSNGVNNDTISILTMEIKQSSLPQNFLESLSLCSEFRKLEIPDQKKFDELFKYCRNKLRLSKHNYLPSINYSWSLLVSHLFINEIPETFKKDQIFVLTTLEKILTSLMNEMVATDFWARQLIMKKGMKMDTINEINNLKIPFVPIKSLIILRQHLSQKLRFGGDGLEQIPHVDSRMAKFLHKNKISSFFKFLDSFGEISLGQNSIAQQKIKMPTKTLLGFLKNLNEAKIKDINCFIEAVPHIDIKTAIDGGNEILEGEKFSLNISLRRLSRQGSLDFTEVKEEIKKLSSVGANKIKAKGGPNVDTENNKIPKGKTKVKKQKIKTLKMRQQAHCPFFPTKKFENWTVVVQKRGQNSFEAIKTISFDRENFNWKLEILPEENGRFVYDITVYSDCYVDLKFRSIISF